MVLFAARPATAEPPADAAPSAADEARAADAVATTSADPVAPQVELALVDDPIGEPGGDPTEAASLEPAAVQPPDEVPDDTRTAHDDDVAGAPVGRIETPRGRHTVFSARYRLTIKGPERGRWEVDVVEEADAPLLTVEMVVRGVQRRSGEGADPERLDGPRLQELLAPAAQG